MMQQKVLLFSAVCCCLLQAMFCEPPSNAMFRPRLLRRSSGKSPSEMLSSLDTPSPSVEQIPSIEVSPPAEYDQAEKHKTPRKKSSKSVSRQNSSLDSSLDIKDLNELKERSKELLLSLLRDKNANRAITFMATNARDVLENEVASKIIGTHTNLIKETLTNKEAKEIIRTISLEIFKRFVKRETPEKVKIAFDKSMEYLSKKNLPELLTKRFNSLKNTINDEKTYPAMVSAKKSLVNSLKNDNIKLKIAKGFKLLDFALHFDPNNVIKSFTGFSFF